LFKFNGFAEGNAPEPGALLRDPLGNLYGTTYTGGFGYGVVFRLAPDGTETVLHKFNGADGDNPYGVLLRTPDGTLYSTTIAGGAYGDGTIYKLAPGESETVVHSFGSGTDGSEPVCGLIRDASGNFYGVTSIGGTYHKGAIFELDSTGTESVLYSFTGGADGNDPNSILNETSTGVIFGTAPQGGTHGGGVIFKLAL
jgi:uncharacterized repeat protein (TIGR03803 family)